MEYQGLSADDLANISALNRFFLVAVSGSASAGFGAIAERRFTDSQLSHLSGAPFLLFSFREQDNDYWQRLLSGNPQIDLIEPDGPPDDRIRRLQVAGLSFIWQLARRNPYAARIVGGAPASWCERLAGSTLVHLVDRAAHRSDLLHARFPDDDKVWIRLLGNGVSSKRYLRQASHQSALQALLTRGQHSHYNSIPAAACNMRTPAARKSPRQSAGFGATKV